MVKQQPKTIAIYRSGILGDTLVALPALWCLREAYPDAHVIYIWQKTGRAGHVYPPQILSNSGLAQEYLCDDLSRGRFRRLLSLIRIFLSLKKKRIDVGIVLEAKFWPTNKRQLFFRFCGVKVILGPVGLEPKIRREKDGTLHKTIHISDELINLLQPLGISRPAAQNGKMSLSLEESEQDSVTVWLSRHGVVNNQSLVAVAPWSNMPLKRWPLENYVHVLQELIKEFQITPIILGGREEREVATILVKRSGRGIVAAGELSVRQGISLLQRCRFYLGNDTGVMHMAVVAGIPCVGIFSAMDMPGRWEPYGLQHSVLRKTVECEGCLLVECLVENMKCIRSISIEEVLDACRRYVGYYLPQEKVQ